MSGGHDGYFDSFRWIAESVGDSPLPLNDLEDRIISHFDVTLISAQNCRRFLSKVKFLHTSPYVYLPNPTKQFLIDGDPEPLILRLHQNAQFIGEMLELLKQPKMTAKLLGLANEQYHTGWKSTAQIDNRRGWLQSAGLITDDRGPLHLTAAGSEFLDRYGDLIEPPFGDSRPKPTPSPPQSPSPPNEPPNIEPEPRHPIPESAERIAHEVLSASKDTKNPSRFERAVRDAFHYLGFTAEHQGGAGKTDVLLNALIGGSRDYRVTIDAKTTASRQLGNHQVDWDTLDEHREQNGADYAVLVGPDPNPGRLMERALDHEVAVLSAETLAELCERHSTRPLGFEDYRLLFAHGGAVDLTEVEERREIADLQVKRAKRILEAVADPRFANLRPLNADKLQGLLSQDNEAVPAQSEIEATLESLASPLIRAIEEDNENGYVLTCSPAVTAHRLRILGAALADDERMGPSDRD